MIARHHGLARALAVSSALLLATLSAPTLAAQSTQNGDWFCERSEADGRWSCKRQGEGEDQPAGMPESNAQPTAPVDPEPEPVAAAPEPMPEPRPEPVSEPEPEPAVAEAPAPRPEPEPAPDPIPEPAPAYDPVQTGAPDTRPDYQRLAYVPNEPTSLLQLPGNFWVAQLMAVSSKEFLEEYAAEHQLRGLSAARVASGDRLFYILILGIYETKDRAQQAITDLPPPYDKYNPFLRSLKSLQQAMQKADEIAGSSEF